MLLAIDIGNTNVTIGLFEKNSLIYKNNIHTDINYDYKQDLSILYTSYSFCDCIISSVVDEITNIIAEAVNAIIGKTPAVVSSGMNLDLVIKAENPAKIGCDRLVNAYAAKKLYSTPAIVIDAGTATTFDIINENGDFIGGLIMPGINTQLKSLSSNTSKLPELNLSDFTTNTKIINTETSKAILSGVVNGHTRAIEGLITDCRQELKQTPITILTGGNANIISKCNKYTEFDYINIDLTLIGLNLIFNHITN